MVAALKANVRLVCRAVGGLGTNQVSGYDRLWPDWPVHQVSPEC